MIDPITVVAMLTVGLLIAAWRERRNARRIAELLAKLHELRTLERLD